MMGNLTDLYQELIIDHGRRPRNFGVCEQATITLEGFNPLCGDRLTLYIKEKDGVIEDILFQGAGCAISMASSSLMTEAVKGQTIAQAQRLFKGFHHLVTAGSSEDEEIAGSKLNALAGVAAFPARVKCATLAWHTLISALNADQQITSGS